MKFKIPCKVNIRIEAKNREQAIEHIKNGLIDDWDFIKVMQLARCKLCGWEMTDSCFKRHPKEIYYEEI